MKKLLFIYNPNAGRATIKVRLWEIEDIFTKAGYEVSVYPTQAYKDAYRRVKELNEPFDLLVCCGGDGTLDEVVSGMMERENKIPIGYIPAGSTNDFAASLHIPADMPKAADLAVHGTPFPCDIGTLNDDPFVYVAAFGIFTDVSYETKQEMKNILGYLAYVLEGVKSIFNVPSYQLKIEHDGETMEENFIYGMVTNSKSVGGFRSIVGENVVLDDGVFEVTLIKSPKNPIDLQNIVGALMLGEINPKYMYQFRTDRMVITSDTEIPWTVDGEYGGSHSVSEIINHNRALEIMVDEKHLKNISVEFSEKS